MMTIIGLLMIYLAVFCHVFLHEREHTLALLKYGFRPHFVAVGAPIPFLGNFYWEVRHPKLLSGIPVRLYPLLIGGAYKLDLTQLRSLLKSKFSVQSEIHSAGIWVNLFLPLVGFGIWAAFYRNWLYAGLCLGIAAALWAGKRLVSVYVFPPATVLIGICVLPKMLAMVFSSHPKVEGTLVYGVSAAAHHGMSWEQALGIALGSGVVLAFLNLLPLLPFDGGRMVHAFLKARWVRASRLYAYVSIPTCLVIVAYSLFLEAYAIAK